MPLLVRLDIPDVGSPRVKYIWPPPEPEPVKVKVGEDVKELNASAFADNLLNPSCPEPDASNVAPFGPIVNKRDVFTGVLPVYRKVPPSSIKLEAKYDARPIPEDDVSASTATEITLLIIVVTPV